MAVESETDNPGNLDNAHIDEHAPLRGWDDDRSTEQASPKRVRLIASLGTNVKKNASSLEDEAPSVWEAKQEVRILSTAVIVPAALIALLLCGFSLAALKLLGVI